MEYCETCHRSLEGGEFTFPWEGDDNKYAYVTCPRCGWKNVQYGYGEDKD